MKPFVNKKITKKIFIILIIITILTGFLPNFVQAETDPEEGGGILEPIEKFVVYLSDKVMQWLQTTFTSSENIEVGDGTYNFQYSPAIIFSGTVPAFDINFIKPNTDTRSNYESFLRDNRKSYYDSATLTSLDEIENRKAELGEYNLLQYHDEDGPIWYNPLTWFEEEKEYYYDIYYLVDDKSTDEKDDDVLKVECFITYVGSGGANYSEYAFEQPINESFLQGIPTYQSTAAKLQGTIASWYNALRRIALVGLLSVLVYVGIRIVLTSSSGDKAKYKGMLKDWLVAICLLFTLHYIMNATLIIINEISDIFSTGETDVLLNTLRESIHSGNSWGEVLAKVIMYVTIVILTVTFTVQYIMRVIYMAFYTLIAPLITLTYPLDKIKDGQAQAFSMWIKEYIFTALTQVIHLVIYFVLVSSALELVTDYPLYAIIVMMFIKKAEGYIKKMFGFDKAETVGTLGAAATGGLVMNALNQLSHKGGKGGKAGGGSSSEGSSNSNVRTATNNPLASLQGNTGAAPQGGSPTPGTRSTPPANTGAPQSPTATPTGNTKPKRNIGGGVKSLIGKHYKQVGGAALGALAGGAGAIIGFSAGVAQGDIGAAFAGAMAGGAAGKNLGQGAVNAVTSMPGNVKNAVNNIGDTWRAGAYGEEYANNVKFDREFRNSSTYKALKENPNFSDESVQSMLDAGITDKGAMEKILNSGGNVDEAIGYYSLAQKCPDDIYYDDAKLEMYLQDLGLSQTDAKTMRTNMKAFR